MAVVNKLIACSLLLLSYGACAAEPTAPTAPALERADVESWMDGFMPYALDSGDVAGAVVVVVKNGDVLLAKGYGYADVAARLPVDPAAHAVPPGLDVQALYLDRGDATGRTRQARPR